MFSTRHNIITSMEIVYIRHKKPNSLLKMLRERIKEPFIKNYWFFNHNSNWYFFFVSKIINKKFRYEKYVQIKIIKKIKNQKEKIFNILNILLLIFFNQ